jgi:hypothetical protein
MKQYQWMATAEKCGNAWKVGVQTEDGCVSFSRKNYATQAEAKAVADKIYKEEEFAVSDFEIDCLTK